MKEVIATTNAPGAIGPYSQATKAGSLVFVSGQLPIDPADWAGFLKIFGEFDGALGAMWASTPTQRWKIAEILPARTHRENAKTLLGRGAFCVFLRRWR